MDKDVSGLRQNMLTRTDKLKKDFDAKVEKDNFDRAKMERLASKGMA